MTGNLPNGTHTHGCIHSHRCLTTGNLFSSKLWKRSRVRGANSSVWFQDLVSFFLNIRLRLEKTRRNLFLANMQIIFPRKIYQRTRTGRTDRRFSLSSNHSLHCSQICKLRERKHTSYAISVRNLSALWKLFCSFFCATSGDVISLPVFVCVDLSIILCLTLSEGKHPRGMHSSKTRLGNFKVCNFLEMNVEMQIDYFGATATSWFRFSLVN